MQQEDGEALSIAVKWQPSIEHMPMEIVANGFGKLRLCEARQFHHADLNAMNTRDNPDRVAPVAAQ